MGLERRYIILQRQSVQVGDCDGCIHRASLCSAQVKCNHACADIDCHCPDLRRFRPRIRCEGG